ncbi:ARM repeat-containing protein [Coniophora puteana RWD-64-598 SS2]|uniref:ARM repeat-containing protein n=1 Tax=Coniophora puteana (strain RWD-64-598) TaxID=741705 RepID=A0A5M3MZ29_CONPW|nr:ARM repeat-containing protein [Coniophora puteana RWD-64-598 SS2]EIW83895.1 ARM repeat-containing protein [Coniophora puteana RWD-64-598 SS2]
MANTNNDGSSACDASNATAPVSLESVAPPKVSANREGLSSAERAARIRAAIDRAPPWVVDRKVRSLLNKLTMKNFTSISNRIIAWAHKSEKEKDGRTLIKVIRLVFETAITQAAWNSMYARLCRKMMWQISEDVQDDDIKNAEGKPIAGGQLFRKYLLNRCQEDFERGWAIREKTTTAAEPKATDEEDRVENEKKGSTDDPGLYLDEYYAAQKARRRGLGLIKFIGELFKLHMLTERIMHECVKKLLGNVENPNEEEIEGLCQLFTTVGQILDTPNAKAHMDVYFQRMKEKLTRNGKVSPRMQFILLDVIELRDRKWVNRVHATAPTAFPTEYRSFGPIHDRFAAMSTLLGAAARSSWRAAITSGSSTRPSPSVTSTTTPHRLTKKEQEKKPGQAISTRERGQRSKRHASSREPGNEIGDSGARGATRSRSHIRREEAKTCKQQSKDETH